MIAGVLPKIASDLSVSLAKAGQLVTMFALAYAVSSPVLTALTGGVDRRRLLIGSMTLFALCNWMAGASGSYETLLIARVLLAIAAGVYVPNANALAASLSAPERRGTALAIVNGGTTLALVFGAPLGAIIGNRIGWRMTFDGVAIVSAIATVGLLIGIPRGVGRGLVAASLRERIAVMHQPPVLIALLVTLFWAAGAFTNYTYVAPYMKSAIGFDGGSISIVLFIWGVAAAIGVFSGGYLIDRVGTRAMLAAPLSILVVCFASLSVSAKFFGHEAALLPVLFAITVWGIVAWAFYPSQLARLVEIAGPHLAPIALSLNASFLNLGLSLGAVFGSAVLSVGSASDLGWTGACCELIAVALMAWSLKSKSRL